MTSLEVYAVLRHFFSIILHTEILTLETSDFLKQIFFLKSFNSVFTVFEMYYYIYSAITLAFFNL